MGWDPLENLKNRIMEQNFRHLKEKDGKEAKPCLDHCNACSFFPVLIMVLLHSVEERKKKKAKQKYDEWLLTFSYISHRFHIFHLFPFLLKISLFFYFSICPFYYFFFSFAFFLFSSSFFSFFFKAQ